LNCDLGEGGGIRVRKVIAAQARALLCLTIGTVALAQAQEPGPAPAVAPGFAIVSGFSGSVQSVASLPPGTNPADKLTIDLGGPVLRAIDANNVGGPPQGQVVAATKPFTVRAAQIGQVYAITLDNAVPPNIYAAATSSYGLPIVVPNASGIGVPDRVRRGAPNAQFMPGLFAPYPGTGPGSIWKISGTDGAISLFATVTPDGVGNAGPALGGLAFDPASRRIYVSDRGSGTIHGFDLQGVETGRFDHGTQALPSIGLPPVPFDPRTRIDIRNPAFDSENPATWGYAPPARRTFGLGVHRGRLYYAVAAGPAVWSVSLSGGGTFGNDPRVEIAFQAGPVPLSEISKIMFDDAGDMLLAERGMPTGAYDFGALTRPDSGRVMRLTAQRPGSDGTPYYWRALGEYATGFAADHRHGDGGIALGPGYSADGTVDPGACGGTLWITGSQLRVTSDPALAQRLALSGALPIDGLQASPVQALRPQNTPPWSSLFIDFDDATDRSGTPGHMGDVAVWRMCPGPLYPQLVELLAEEVLCPAGFFASRNQCIPAPCAPGELYRGGVCDKPECRPNERIGEYCCPPGSKWNPVTKTCDRKRPDRPDLALKKELGRCAPHGGPCTFTITVTNDSNVPYTGPILVGDAINPGVITGMTGPAGYTCGQVSGNIWACIDLDTTLAPHQSIEFTVVAMIPASAKRWLNCAGVKGDDAKDSSSGNNKSCVKGGDDDKPDKPDTSKDPGVADLSVRKQLRSCSGNTCEFVIVIRNTGTADYNGDLRLNETIQGGTVTNIHPFDSGWSLPCQSAPALQGMSSLVCSRPNTSLAPGETLTVGVTVTHPPGSQLVKNCASVPVPGDPNRDNNGSCALHQPEDPRPKLVVEKTRVSCGRLIGVGGGAGGYACEFEIVVTNTGPGSFTGDIKVTDTVTPGRIVSVGGEANDCPNYGTSLLCQWFDRTLQPGQSTRIRVRVNLPPGNVPYENCARLDAPAGSEQSCVSGQPSDPEPPRESSLPDPFCRDGTFLIRPPGGSAQCCTLRSIVAGTCGGVRVGCPEGTSFNLRTGTCDKKEKDKEACAADARLRDGTCCPAGQKVSDGRCQPQLTCRADQIVSRGECVCPGSQRESDGKCVDPPPVRTAQSCTADRVWNEATNACVCRSGREAGGICLPPTMVDCTGGRLYDAATNQCVCPAGQTDVGGTCRPQSTGQPIQCKEGQVRIGSGCVDPDPACTGGKVRSIPGGACTCPRGTQEIRDECVTIRTGGTCQGGTRNSWTGQCTCPRGTALVDGDCKTPESPGFMPVVCHGDTRLVGGQCVCPGDMQKQADGTTCACPAGFGIKPGGLTPIGRKERGLCERCPPGQGLTPDGYCAPPCPQEVGWVCLPPGGEATPVQGSNCACMNISPLPPCLPGQRRDPQGFCWTPLEQTIDRPRPCPSGLIRQFDRCCTPESIAAGTCGGSDGTPPPTTVCAFPLVAFGGQCCSREAIAAGRCGTPVSECARGQVRGPDGRCFTPPGTTQPGCGPNQFRGDDGRCHDRPGTTQPRCGTNQFRGDDGRCYDKPSSEKLCPDGSKPRKGGRCPSVQDSGKKDRCVGGRIDTRGKCVMPPSTRPVKKPPPTLRQPSPGFKPTPPPNVRRTIMPVRPPSPPVRMRGR
jgi:hypothetical protein